MFPALKPGGRFQPSNCIARSKVALVIPYRDREEHLRIFLHNLHPILQRQQLDYGIYIIEEVINVVLISMVILIIKSKDILYRYNLYFQSVFPWKNYSNKNYICIVSSNSKNI